MNTSNSARIVISSSSYCDQGPLTEGYRGRQGCDESLQGDKFLIKPSEVGDAADGHLKGENAHLNRFILRVAPSDITFPRSTLEASHSF